MLAHLAPRFFAAQGLAATRALALERCASVTCSFERPLDPGRLEAGIDAWYCRHLAGLPHPAPEATELRAALLSLADEGQFIYAWLLGEQAARCGLDVRVPVDPRLHRSRLHEGYWLTHLVLLESDYFARKIDRPEWAEALEAFVPWLGEHPSEDLAGEVAFCLRFLGREVELDLPLSPTLSPPGGARGHAIATALLALSAE